MTRILVTGASGFIGRVLCRTLSEQGYSVIEVTSRAGDIAEPHTFKGIEPVHHVFHLAGRTFIPDSWQDPAGFHRTNVVGTANVLEFCRRCGARLTFVSAYVYGIPAQLPISEAAPARPNNPYASSKLAAEEACAYYAAYCGLDVTVVRPFNIFGPGQRPDFLIPLVIDQVVRRQPIRVKDLAPRRDYIYVDDLVNALIGTLQAPRGYHVFNLGSGESMSVGELVAAIQSVAGTSLPVISDNASRPDEIPDVVADTTKARADLGWWPRYSFTRGIEQMLSAVALHTDPSIYVSQDFEPERNPL